jgi:spermidine synthase
MSNSMDAINAKSSKHLSLFFMLFGLSGFAGLIYESIWTQYLKLFLGHATYAQMVVLIIFMGGMFLGAWLVARRAEKIKNPLLMYVCIEMLIGFLALIFHSVFVNTLDFSYNTIIPSLSSPWQVSIYKWIVAALLILPQTMLLGMTFPLMSNGLIRRYRELPGKSIAMLYFSNSFGGAVGVLVAGFYLLQMVGLPGTILAAGIINMLVASFVYVLIRSQDHTPLAISPSAEDANDRDRGIYRLFMSIAFLTGAASFMYEIGWIRMLSMVLGASTHAFELMLSAFILGLSLGSLWINFRIDKLKNSVALLGYIQLAMGAMALFSLLLYTHSFFWMSDILALLTKTTTGYFFFNLSSDFIVMCIMLPTTFCAGTTLPLLTYSLIKRGCGEKSIGDIYAWNTAGAIIGTVIAVYVGMPYLGLKGLIMLGAAIDMAAGLWLLTWIKNKVKYPLVFFFMSIALLIYAGFGVYFNPQLMVSGVFRTGRTNETVSLPVIYYHDGRVSSVSMQVIPPKHYILSTNGKPDATVNMQDGGTPGMDEWTQSMLAALPLSIVPDAKTVAVIGFGSGSTSHTLLTDTDLVQVDTIEIEPAMVEASKLFGEHNKKVYQDPRSHIYIDDAKTFFSAHHAKYDIIISEPSNPWVSGVASLFTDEFYSQVKQHLTTDGVFVQWLQLYEINPELLSSVFKALNKNFPYYEVYNPIDTDLIIVARNSSLPITLSPHIFKFPELMENLKKLSIYSVDDLSSHRIGSQQTLNAIFSGFSTRANSDYFPVLDILSSKALFMNDDAFFILKVNFRGMLDQIEHAQSFKSNKAVFPFFLKSSFHGNAMLMLGFQNSELPFTVLKNLSAEMQLYNVILKNSNKYCMNTEMQANWASALFYVNLTVLPFFDTTESNLWLNTVIPNACYQQLSATNRLWIDLYRAQIQSNFSNIQSLSVQLLEISIKNGITGTEQIYLLRMAMLSSIIQQQPALAIQLYKKYNFLGQTGSDGIGTLEIDILVRIASSQIMNKQS